MIARCPVCRTCVVIRGRRHVLIRGILTPCRPCQGSGRIEIIPRAQCELESKWLPIDKVAGLKARERGEVA